MNVLYDNIFQFKKSADIIYATDDFTSASILYFKCLFSILDYTIFNKIGVIPKDHNERFRILENLDKNLYIVLDKLYVIYRSAYNIKIEKNKCNEVKQNVERLIKEQKL